MNSSDRFARASRVSVSIIVPVFNEAETVRLALAEVLELDLTGREHEVIVIESNSNDGSRDIVTQICANFPQVRLLFERQPRGKGHAVRLGLSHARCDVIAIFDSDLEYRASDILRLLTPIENGRTSFVLGARSLDSNRIRSFEHSPWLSNFLNAGHYVMKWIFRIFFGGSLNDPFTMHKVFRREVFDGVELKSNRFDLDWELVGIALRRGAVPIEVPVFYRSRDFSQGKKVRLIRDPLNWIRAALLHRFRPL